jgi:NAD(P)-dependent dehydrogenase (short-subunit alcohol dehydrogenase family)
MVNLSGKTALVTGASRGIGRASALALAQAGAQVLVHYGRGKTEAEGVVAEIRAHVGSGGGRPRPWRRISLLRTGHTTWPGRFAVSLATGWMSSSRMRAWQSRRTCGGWHAGRLFGDEGISPSSPRRR